MGMLVPTFANERIPTVREVFSRKLRRLRFPPDDFNLVTKMNGLKYELGDDVNVSHFSWDRLYTRVVSGEISVTPGERGRVSLGLANREAYPCNFWSTERIVEDPSDEHPGIAQLDPGGAYQIFCRDSDYWIPSPSGLYYQLGPDKITYTPLGYLAEDDCTNDIKNSAFRTDIDTTADWTKEEGVSGSISVFGGGSIPDIFHSGADVGGVFTSNTASEEVYVWQSYPVQANAKRFISISYSSINSPGLAWWLSRSSDGWYWDDSGEQWVNTRTVNYMPNTLADPIDITTGVFEFNHSNRVIGGGSSDTWTLEVGSDTTSVNPIIRHVQSTNLPYPTGPVITDEGLTYTRKAQTRYWVLDVASGELQRQLWPGKYGTTRLGYIPLVDHADLEDADYLVLMYGLVGTDPANFDLLAYERVSSGVGQFVFERHVGGNTYKSTVPHTLAADEDLDIAGVWLDAAEQGRKAKSIAVFVDGISAASDTSTPDSHSTTEPHSELWIGGGPPTLAAELPGVTVRHALGYLYDIEIVRKPFKDDAILGRR
jgi:hypothetical protein